MAKLNREIDKQMIENSKFKTMNIVMDQINEEKVPWYNSLLNLRTGLLLATSIALLFIIGFTFGTPTSSPTIYALDEENSETVAEMSYIASQLVAVEFDLSNTTPEFGVVFLSNVSSSSETETEFETSIEDVTTYFNMLRMYFNQAVFQDSIAYIELEDSIYDVEITFVIDDVTYLLLVTQVDDNQFEGIMEVNGVAFDVIGKITSEDGETKFNFEAVNGEDSVNIEYKDETDDDESKKSYSIQTRNNNVISEKEITVKIEDDETKVEIVESGHFYELKQEFEDGEMVYKLEYKINDQQGQVTITEDEDINGECNYNFQVKEGNVEKDIEVGPPSFVDRDPNSNSSNNNNGNSNNNNDDDDDNDDDSSSYGGNSHNYNSNNSNGNNNNDDEAEQEDKPEVESGNNGNGQGKDKEDNEDDDLEEPEEEPEQEDEPEEEPDTV